MGDSISFQDMDGYTGGGGKFGLTFKEIVIQHINRCVVKGSVEWHGGYWNEVGYNPTIKTYVPNTRDVYCNSVKMLRACLLGYYDDKMKEADIKLKGEYQIKFKEYNDLIREGKLEKDDWYSYKTEWHILLFEELIQLSKRLNFFEEQSAVVEVD